VGRSFWFYIFKTIWPYPLMPIYPRHLPDTGSLVQWLPPVGAVLLLIVPLLQRQRGGKGVFVCLAVYAALIAPSLGFLPQGLNQFSFAADHFIYLAGAGLLIPLCHLLLNLSDQFIARGMRGYLPIAALAVPFAALTFSQSLLYRDSETLFRRNLKNNPDSWGVHTALGAVALSQPGGIDTALEHFQEAVRLEPEAAQAHYNLAVALENSGKIAEATGEYTKALEIAPDYAEAHNNLAILLTNQGRLDEAMIHITEAVRIKPGDKEFWENKNSIRRKINQPAEVPMDREGTEPVIGEQSSTPSPTPLTAPGMDPGYGLPSEQESPR
jgi:protein O-mannosyl-transferase